MSSAKIGIGILMIGLAFAIPTISIIASAVSASVQLILQLGMIVIGLGLILDE